MISVLSRLARFCLVPVVVLDDAADAAPLAQALVSGGLPVAEATFRTKAAADSIRSIADRGDVVVCAVTVLTALNMVRAAKRHGTVVSYGLNYRPSLWKSISGEARAQEVNRVISEDVDVMIGNEEDFTGSLGFEVEGVDESLSRLEIGAFAAMIDQVARTYPNIGVIATTLRTVRSATINDWGAIAWSPQDGLVRATHRPGLEILDRVGSGDSFASGLVFGLLEGVGLQDAVEYGAAHGPWR